jgi:ATP/maltotriose-dependent transcriptional regulator MalT
MGDARCIDQAFSSAANRTRVTPSAGEPASGRSVYGEWLRRRQRVEARSHLRTAYEMCVSISMEAFAERPRRKLPATGETVRKRTAETTPGAELTAQERQIAQLVRDGFSTPEVGARLFLSRARSSGTYARSSPSCRSRRGANYARSS